MIAATNHLQRKAQHGNAATFHCGMGRAAPIADGYQSNCRVSSSLPVTRREKPRANSRGCQRAPGFFFTPVSTDPDDLVALRLARLNGSHPVLSRAQAVSDHREAVTAVVAKVDHNLERLSSVRPLDGKTLTERASQGRGNFTQARGRFTQGEASA